MCENLSYEFIQVRLIFVKPNEWTSTKLQDNKQRSPSIHLYATFRVPTPQILAENIGFLLFCHFLHRYYKRNLEGIILHNN